MQNTATGNFKCRSAFCLFDEKSWVGHVCAFQTFGEVIAGEELSSAFARERGSVHGKEHRDGRRVDVNARQVHRIIDSRKSIADIEHFKACDLNNFARTCFVDRNGLNSVVMQNFLNTNVLDFRCCGIVVREEALRNGHARLKSSLLNAANRHTSEEARIFESADLKKRSSFRIALRSRNFIDDEIHQNAEIAIRIIDFFAANAFTTACVNAREIQLFFGRIEFAEKIKDFVQSVVRIATVAVNLIDDDDRS